MEEQFSYELPQEVRAEPKHSAGAIIQEFNYADTFRRQYEEPALRYYRQYAGYREALSAEFTGRSNLHIPRTYEEIDTLRSRIIKTIFATRPYVDFVPRPSGYVPDGIETKQYIELLEAKAKIAASKVDNQLDGMLPAMYDFITSLMIYPVAINAVGWKYETRTVKETVQQPIYEPVYNPDAGVDIDTVTDYEDKEVLNEVIVYDDNEIKNVDFFDFWPDPRGTNLDNMRFCFHREWLTKDELKDYLTWMEKVKAGTVFWPDDWDSIAGAGVNIEDGRISRQAVIGLQAETEQGYWEKPSDGYLYEVLHRWSKTTHSMLINRHAVIFEGDNPYTKHGKVPFITAVFEPLPGEFYGLSACALLEHLQEELNTTRNQRIDNVSFILNRMWKVRNGADIDESELISRPAGIIHVDNPDDVTEMSTALTVGPDSYKEEEILKLDMENAVGVPGVVRGASDTNEQTATEVVTKSSSAGIRFDSKIMLFEAMSINRLAYLMDCNNQQFCDSARLMQIYGPLGAEWKMVDPDSLVGEHDYRPAGSSVEPMANKEIRRNQLNQLFTALQQTPSPYVDMYELTRLLLETYDIRNVDTVMRNKEEVQQELAQQQALAQSQGLLNSGQTQQPQQATPGYDNMGDMLAAQGGGSFNGGQ